MSALPPKADMDRCGRDVRFVPKADSCSATKIPLFDYLVGAHEQRDWYFNSDRFGGFEIDDQLVFSWKLNR